MQKLTKSHPKSFFVDASTDSLERSGIDIYIKLMGKEPSFNNIPVVVLQIMQTGYCSFIFEIVNKINYE